MVTSPSPFARLPPTFHVAEVVGDSAAANLLVEGDNLRVLEALLPAWAGRAKVVYIDPPYNTGHTHWRYSDRWDDWVAFMRPRVERLRELIAPEGALFVSIDDRELFRLGILLDEVFGEENRLAVFCWEKKYGTQNDSRGISANHEYVLCYARDRAKAQVRLLPRSEEMDRRYRNPDADPRGPWKCGDFSVKTPSEKYMYPIKLPSGRVVTPPPGRSWCTSKERYRRLVAEKRIWFGTKGDAKPQLKQFLTEVRGGRVPSSLWSYREVGHTDTAKKELKRILDVSARDFQTPKPTALVKRCVMLFAGPDDLVVDVFAGTGTTGQAVLELNREDGGRRRFLLVESGSGDDRFCRDLTAERLRRVISGRWESGAVRGTGGGFRFVRLSASAASRAAGRASRGRR